MSYNLSFDGLRRDICTLAAWMLSYKGAQHLNDYKLLRDDMVEFHKLQTGTLLLSIAAQLRIIQDTTKGKNSKYQNTECGEISHNNSQMNDGKGFILSVPQREEYISFEGILDKILHATIKVERFRQESEEGTQFIIRLKGNGREKGSKWQVDLDILKFCQTALGFINDKEKHYQTAA